MKKKKIWIISLVLIISLLLIFIMYLLFGRNKTFTITFDTDGGESIEDGIKCTKATTTDMVINTGCPSGTETIETFCSSHKRQGSVGFDEDQTFVDAGILCEGKFNNFSVDYNSRYTKQTAGCPSGYFSYIYSESGLDAEYVCVKKI